MRSLIILLLIATALGTGGCLTSPALDYSYSPEIKPAPGGLIPRPLRPGGEKDIRYIMLHAISDAAANPTSPYRLERIRAIFEGYQVEAHYVIDREGQIYRFVSDACLARHAGRGSWAGDPQLTDNMNRYAIGIELLGIGSAAQMEYVIGPLANGQVRAADRGYTPQQYAALDFLLEHLMQRYAIPPENILTHHQYDPGRKWDPGELFDWEQLRLEKARP